VYRSVSPHAAGELLPLVCDELRQLAAAHARTTEDVQEEVTR
jgi:hypothetical protein